MSNPSRILKLKVKTNTVSYSFLLIYFANSQGVKHRTDDRVQKNFKMG